MTDLFNETTNHDPGGKVRLKVATGMEADAAFSPCGKYRHWLSRRWGDGGFALWVGMNPSTATAHVDDPTIRREIEFTKRMGLNAYFKVNIMDYRATDPKRLLEIAEPRSERNLEEILRLMDAAECVILAYGSIPAKLSIYAFDVRMLLAVSKSEALCLGVNKDGSPKHPLYVRGDTPLVKYEMFGS